MPAKGEVTPQVLRGFRETFMDYVQEIINEGRETEEIKDRKYISDKYKDGLWLQTMFIINFWLKDDSESFEKTDAAIEKAVNLSYDLMGAGPLDKMLDFAKFLYQNRV
ncbi:MAG: TetR family transcriptional regulator C-terminal domain-containing protein [Cyclobacteriaceae bacterium]